MQASIFKTILEYPEAADDLLSGRNSAERFTRFAAMAASVLASANSKPAEKSNVSMAAMNAYAEDEYVKQSKPVLPPVERPISLAQLREKLGTDLSIAELHRLRRKFAFQHHPDRLPKSQHHTATTQLATANALIDLAIGKFEG